MNTLRLFAAPRSVSVLNRSQQAYHTSRSLHLMPTAVFRGKDDLMDKDALNPTSTEHSKTDGGDAAAAHESTAFDPKDTDPDSETRSGGNKQTGEKQNPLNVSPGNSQVNQDATGGQEQQTSRGAAGKKQSTKSGATKHGTGSP